MARRQPPIEEEKIRDVIENFSYSTQLRIRNISHKLFAMVVREG